MKGKIFGRNKNIEEIPLNLPFTKGEKRQESKTVSSLQYAYPPLAKGVGGLVAYHYCNNNTIIASDPNSRWYGIKTMFYKDQADDWRIFKSFCWGYNTDASGKMNLKRVRECYPTLKH